MLAGMGEWADTVIAILIKLPLLLVWVLTLFVAIVVVWRLGRKFWYFASPKLDTSAPPPTPTAGPPTVG